MAIDPRHAAVHEAGHAVLQWFVGWESDLRFIQMRRVNSEATEARTNARMPTCRDLPTIRKRLVFLCAGNTAATKKLNQNMYDFDEDFKFATQALGQFCGHVRSFPTSIRLEPKEADELLQNAIQKTNELVDDPTISTCIDEVSQLLLNATPAPDGMCIVSGPEIVVLCKKICGPDFRDNHELTRWLNGS